MNISQWKITDRSFFDFFASLGHGNELELIAILASSYHYHYNSSILFAMNLKN